MSRARVGAVVVVGAWCWCQCWSSVVGVIVKVYEYTLVQRKEAKKIPGAQDTYASRAPAPVRLPLPCPSLSGTIVVGASVIVWVDDGGT